MVIKRINNYIDSRFSMKVLKQHGAFELDDMLYEVEIISDFEAIIRGPEKHFEEIIEEFRFYSGHITKFYNDKMKCVAEFDSVPLFPVEIARIQPSQFYVDIDKKKAVSEFINDSSQVIIPLVKTNDQYISLDGHTRLAVAIDKGYNEVRGYIAEGGEWLMKFVDEAIKRGIKTPYDIKVLSHEEYDLKWNKFCDELFKTQQLH